MADDPAQQRGSKRARRPTARASSSSSTANTGALAEADRVIEALHELRLISTSLKPDRRSIAYAVAHLRGQLPTGRNEQAALFGLREQTLAQVRVTWIEDEHTRLEQALRYLVLPASERADFLAERAPGPSEQQLVEREARKRQRLETERRDAQAVRASLAVTVDYVERDSHERVSYAGHVDQARSQSASSTHFGIFVRFEGGGGKNNAWIVGPVNTVDDGDFEEDADRPDEWRWHQPDPASELQRQLEQIAEQGFAQRRALLVHVTRADGGQRRTCRGKVDACATDAAPHGRFGICVAMPGASDPRARPTWIVGPVNVDGMEAEEEEEEEVPADVWRWAYPDAMSLEQQRLERIAAEGLVRCRAQAVERRQASALKAHNLWDPHAMHTLGPDNTSSVPKLHRMLSHATSSPGADHDRVGAPPKPLHGAPPTWAQLFCVVPHEEREAILRHHGCAPTTTAAPLVDDGAEPAGQRRAALRAVYWLRHDASVPGSAAGEPRKEDYMLPTGPNVDAERRQLRRHVMGNVTTFCRDEAANPIYFFEQSRRCYFCGRHLFVIETQCTCHDGKLIHDDVLPGELLDLLTQHGGVSKESRAMNELGRLCTLALPRNTRRQDHVNGGHMRITGLPYRIVEHLNENNNARSYLHDPMRRVDRERYARGFQPSDDMIRSMYSVLDSNPYWNAVLRFSADPDVTTARLVLRWPGSTPVVRAFTSLPDVSLPGPRTVYVTKEDDDEVCRVRSDDPRYSLLSWPLLFPNGRLLLQRPPGKPSQWPARSTWPPFERKHSLEADASALRNELSQTTMAVAYQPERRLASREGSPNPYVLVPTRSPYRADARVPRPFSRVELAGRVGEEYILDKYLSRVDSRRWQLLRLQSHLRGRTLTAAERAEHAAMMDDEEAAANENDTSARRSSYIPASEIGTPAHHRKTAAQALCVAHKTHRPLCFITQTLNPECPEIRTRLACFPNDDGSERVQEAFDRPGLHCDVFEGKHRALAATLQSGTVYRNLGRPERDRSVDVRVGSGRRRQRVAVDRYRYPMTTRTVEGGARGHLLRSRENQRNGFEHMHYTYAPSQPKPEWTVAVHEGEPLPWVDEMTCARVPDRSVLIQFKMLLPASEARALAGVAAPRSHGPDAVHESYAYLRDARAPSQLVVHPDLVHDGGARFSDPNCLLREIIELSTAEGVQLVGCHVRLDGPYNIMLADGGAAPPGSLEALEGATGEVLAAVAPPAGAADADEADACAAAGYMYFVVRLHNNMLLPHSIIVPRVCLQWIAGGAPPRHYSQNPYTNTRRKGPMVHVHKAGPHVAEEYCMKEGACGSYFPKEEAAFTRMGVSGFLEYQRGPADLMVVAYNPWFLFYHRCHLNVEVVGCGVRALLYLFKLLRYVFKPHETNKGQVVPDGEAMQGTYGDPEERTHRRQQPFDEVNYWFSVQETCSPYALRAHKSRQLFFMHPRCEDLRVHEARDADAFENAEKQQDMSDFEVYLARPELPELNGTLCEDFFIKWKSAPTPLKPKGPANAALQASFQHYNCATRTVYVGADPTRLRLPGAETGAPPVRVTPRFYWRRTPGFDAAAVRDAGARARGAAGSSAMHAAPSDAESDDDEHEEQLEGDDDDEGPVVRLSRVPMRRQNLFYLRELARRRPARSFAELLTDDAGTRHESAQATCRALGYLDEAHEARSVLESALAEPGSTSPCMLRSLIVQFIMAHHAVDTLLDMPGVYDALTEAGGSHEDVRVDLASRLLANNVSISDVLPTRHQPQTWLSDLDREIAALLPRHEWRRRAGTATQPGTDSELALDGAQPPFEQTAVVYWALTGERPAQQPTTMRPIDLSTVPYVPPTATEVGFVLGEGGAGKSRVCQRTIAEFGARGMFTKSTAVSNLAASAFERGSTVHGLFLLGIHADDDGNLVIQLESSGGTVTDERDEMLRDMRCGCIIIDEGLSGSAKLIDAVVTFCQSRRYLVRILINGDPHQLPPVVPFGSVQDVISASVLSSMTWNAANEKFVLKRQHRGAGDPAWAAFLRTLAKGTAARVEGHAFNNVSAHATAVAMPLITTIFVHQPRVPGDERAMAAIKWLFGVRDDGTLDVFHRPPRLIQTATNSQRNWWNALVSRMRATERGSERFTFEGVNTANVMGGDDMTEDLALEALRDEAHMFDHADHSVPLSSCDLGVGDLVMLPKTVDKSSGLVKNKMLRVRRLMWNAIEVENERDHSRHLLCRQRFEFSLTGHLRSVTIKRLQVPAQLAWAITVNKAQGTTIPRTLLDLRRPYWQHGSGYVAPARVPTSHGCAAYVDARSSIVDGRIVPVICNVVLPGLTLDA